jgi:protein-lysine N-methyltransferase EEF2KMT
MAAGHRNVSRALHADLFELKCGYSGIRPVQAMTFPSSLDFNLVHDFFLNHLLLDQHLGTYAPDEEYQRTFWKWAINGLEQLSVHTCQEYSDDHEVNCD